MPLQIVRNDITTMKVDAIVNAAKNSLLGGGGVDGAIHTAAGPELLEECKTLNGCATGDAKITKGYNLPAKFVIHTVGPVWDGGSYGEEEYLKSCYRRSLELAADNELYSVAFPLISAGVYGYPMNQAFQVAVDTISTFLEDHDMMVYIVVYDRRAFANALTIEPGIKEYIDDNYVATHKSFVRGFFERKARGLEPDYDAMRYNEPLDSYDVSYDACEAEPIMARPNMAAASSSLASSKSLEEAISAVDESFTQSLLRIIDNKGLKDSFVYKKANVDRKLFSKIRSDVHYRPKKNTALALAIALELSLEETEALIRKAGYAISPSNVGDVIVKYFIENRKYNVNEINMVLFSYDMPILGSN